MDLISQDKIIQVNDPVLGRGPWGLIYWKLPFSFYNFFNKLATIFQIFYFYKIDIVLAHEWRHWDVELLQRLEISTLVSNPIILETFPLWDYDKIKRMYVVSRPKEHGV